MDKLQQIFNREYNSNLNDGDSHQRAVYWAIDYIETCVKNVRIRFNYDGFRMNHAEDYFIYEQEKELVKVEAEKARIQKLRDNAVIGFHKVGSVFNLKTSKGVYRLKVVEQPYCKGCIFAKITSRAMAGYFTYGCCYDYHKKNAYCSAEMREDGKRVAYIPIKNK